MWKLKLLAFIGASLICFVSMNQREPISPSQSSSIAFDEEELVTKRYGRQWVYYAQVNKAGDYFRRMFIDTLSAAQLVKTGELRIDALMMMETWYGKEQGTVYIRQNTADGWRNGDFQPSSPNYAIGRGFGCNSCHSKAAVTSYTYTLPLLTRALKRQRVVEIECNESSFTPCDLSVYKWE